jgi:hypothetical protein
LFENGLDGNYSLRARHDGFDDAVVAGIVLAARQDSRYTLTMTIAATASTVEVTSTATQINTENEVLADSKGGAQIGEFPLNFRASTTSPLAALTTSANMQTDNQGNVWVARPPTWSDTRWTASPLATCLPARLAPTRIHPRSDRANHGGVLEKAMESPRRCWSDWPVLHPKSGYPAEKAGSFPSAACAVPLGDAFYAADPNCLSK